VTGENSQEVRLAVGGDVQNRTDKTDRTDKLGRVKVDGKYYQKWQDVLQRFKDELANVELNPEQREIYNAVVNPKKTARIRINDLNELEDVYLQHGTRKKGAYKIISIHYAGMRNPVTALEVVSMGDVIRRGTITEEGTSDHPDSRRYELKNEDGSTLKLIVDKDKKKAKTVINFYSDRKAEAGGNNKGLMSDAITVSNTNITSFDEKSSAETELVLSAPEKVQDINKNISFVGRDEETGKIYRIEIQTQVKAKANHIRSVFEITPNQYEKCKLDSSPVLQLSPTGISAGRTLSSFLKYNITGSGEKSSADSEKIGLIGLIGLIRPIGQGELDFSLHDRLQALPQALEYPLAVVANLTPNAKPGSVVAITDMDVDGKKIVVPVLIEAISSSDDGRIDSHLVLTVYDSADWVNAFLTPALEAEKNGIGIFYFDKEKAGRYSAYSKKIGSIPTGVVHNIAQSGINVKPQTETLQFKRWFGDSKVVDENGKPLVVNHGTRGRFFSFDDSQTGSNIDFGTMGICS